MIAVRDLQIGDFINTENNGVVQITVLSWRGVGYEGGASTPEHCSYIPLTEEILVKNGFEKTTDDWNRHIPLIIFESVGFPTISIHADMDMKHFWVHGTIDLTYVHQLQHLLRLCGIEKEIEL